jgi:hypothetical protein
VNLKRFSPWRLPAQREVILFGPHRRGDGVIDRGRTVQENAQGMPHHRVLSIQKKIEIQGVIRAQQNKP